MEAEIWAGLARFFTYSNKVPVTFYIRVADPGGTAPATATNLKESEEENKLLPEPVQKVMNLIFEFFSLGK